MKTKKIITTLICLFSIGMYAQKNEFKLHYGISDIEYSYYVNGVKATLDCGTNSSVENLKEIGFSYNRKLTPHLSIETGIKFINADLEPYDKTFKMTSIPILANYTFWKYLYVNGGIQVDFHKDTNTIESQSGIGYLVGFGAKYEFNNFMVFVNPNYQRHKVISFNEENDKRKLHGKTVNFGIGYRF